ncbi:MAG: S9 family peptidase [Bacteroidia bacterium]|nr:S9 family peptidase [Bacteroidia bacterium]
MKNFLLFILTLILFIPQSEGQMTAMDVAKIQSVTSAIMSDDGTYVIYTLSVPADPFKENKRAQSKLYLYDVGTMTSRPLVTQGSVFGVAIRPGHESITFLNRRDGDANTSLYELSLKGGEAQNIMSYDQSITSYQWNHDGSMLLFSSREVKKSKSALPFEPELYEKDLVYSRAYIAKPGMDMMVRKCEFEGHLVSMKWSPDGKKVAGFIAASPLVDDFYMTRKLQVVDAMTGKLVNTVLHEGKKGAFAWSPDSKHIAFIAGANLNDPIDGRLFVVAADEDRAKNIRPNFEGQFHNIEWSDNETIRFLASEGSFSSVGHISMGGRTLKRTIPAEGPVIQSMSWSKDGDGAFVASSPSNPGELYVMRSGGIMKKVTDHNPWIKERKLAKQEVITYKAADGLEIEGILMYPLEYEEGTKYPVIHYIHGGPESHVNNSWITGYSQPGQVAATKGMAVFYPNYRGSTGRGLDYTLTSQGDPAGKEFDDIVDGSKHLINIGLADPEKIGVTGGSYGGYATGWMSTRYSDHFAAGVMFVGISNKVSKWGTTDIPKEEYLVHARKWIWEDYDFYLKRSPVYYADQCETPLLIMHGAEDPRVHPSQSMELYRHVKVRTDTPVSLVFYPGEGHGNRNATARLDYNIRSLRWFEKYLQDKDLDVDAPVVTKVDKP